jgi:P pilus assembly chaperone PapD
MRINKATTIMFLNCLLTMILFNKTFAGYTMTPLVTILDLSKHATSAEVFISSLKGDAKIPVALELKVRGRVVSQDGSKVTYPDDNSVNDLAVYPMQIVLLPGETQKVQIKWVGEKIPDKETAYGLICEQAPLAMGDENEKRTTAEARMNILVRYEGMILLRPAGIKPNTVVDSAGPRIDSAGNAHLMILLKNNGTAREKIQGVTFELIPLDKRGKMLLDKKITYKPVLTMAESRQKLYAGYKRLLDMPWPKNFTVSPVKAVPKFEPDK